jgi:hypothetical protein
VARVLEPLPVDEFRQAEDRTLSRLEVLERLPSNAADGLAAGPPRRDESRAPQPANVPRDERLGQADLGDELRDRRGTGGETPDDSQAVDVGECLVDEAQVAQLVGLEDGVGEGAADPGGRRRQGSILDRAVASTAVYINRR